MLQNAFSPQFKGGGDKYYIVISFYFIAAYLDTTFITSYIHNPSCIGLYFGISLFLAQRIFTNTVAYNDIFIPIFIQYISITPLFLHCISYSLFHSSTSSYPTFLNISISSFTPTFFYCSLSLYPCLKFFFHISIPSYLTFFNTSVSSYLPTISTSAHFHISFSMLTYLPHMSFVFFFFTVLLSSYILFFTFYNDIVIIPFLTVTFHRIPSCIMASHYIPFFFYLFDVL